MNNKMEKIIKKALEGGWGTYPIDFRFAKQNFVEEIVLVCPDEDELSEREKLTFSEIICDPLFWQALGNACGWAGVHVMPVSWISSNRKTRGEKKILKTQFQEKIEWQYHALRFHEINLTESFEKAVEYLSSITK